MYKRIVIKVGTNLLTDEKGIKRSFLRSLVNQAAVLHEKGKEIIIVSSGAIGAGIRKLGMASKPVKLPEKQAVAAVGQITLMHAYESLFAEKNINVAQVLLEHDDIRNRTKNINAKNTLRQLLEWKVIPVINENDTVATDEIKFGDNDALAGIVGNLVDADIVIILTSVDGIYDKNPDTNKDARILNEITDVSSAEAGIDTSGKTASGTGGMKTKLDTARLLNQAGIPMVIANGAKEGVIERIVSGKKEGTLIKPSPKKADSRKRHILLDLKENGVIKIDEGAKTAIVKSGKSLLAVGITGVKGSFSFGDAVEIVGPSGERVAKGITNYPSEIIERYMGKKNSEISRLAGEGYYGEVVHRDNMFVYK
ncbi:MAG TPA: glutamate 5-kinase [Candidatus Goldiibacteriota bacterium]|nr:glutamate 5-kinase [Candidatus Goldiibacteriota bacterium]